MDISAIIPARPAEEAVARDLAASLLQMGAGEVFIQFGEGGVARARNNGARYAKGDLLLFLDADIALRGRLDFSDADYWVPTWADASGDPVTRTKCAMQNLVHHLGVWHGILGGFLAIRKEVFWQVGGWSPDAPYEDCQMGSVLYRQGFRRALAPLTAYQRRPLTPLLEAPQRIYRPPPASMPVPVRLAPGNPVIAPLHA